jgi:acylphosphatase
MRHCRIVVRGAVQGVGFRYFLYRLAPRLGIRGWVRNCDDGAVEIDAEGDAARVMAFIEAVKRGNGHADIRSVVVDERTRMANHTRFTIRG